jgi:hypothetical protein
MDRLRRDINTQSRNYIVHVAANGAIRTHLANSLNPNETNLGRLHGVSFDNMTPPTKKVKFVRV